MEPQQNHIPVSPKEFFFHLGALVTLVATAISSFVILFSIINIAFPDSADISGYVDYSGIRFAMATLIVVFPAYFFVTRFLRKIAAVNPVIKTTWVRRWLTGLIVFITGTVVLGDVVSVVFGFVNGDLSSRFAFKALSILVVMTVLFLYYFFESKEVSGKNNKIISIISWVGPLVAVIILVLGFAYTGLPGTARSMRLDENRVNDLVSMQDRVVTLYQNTGIVPTSTEAFVDNISFKMNLVDKETKIPYVYKKTGDLSFSLCAHFALGREGNDVNRYSYGVAESNWSHPEGDYCFDRTINKDLYPVIKAQAVKE